ncbi:MAG: hypothetical protein QMD85_05795 [Candidatus Aenigmarchaeota archaeon]|nr:hypothetical protein [Candidatus Aenigmarchaeota archaeon]
MKGQQQAISLIIISGILISIVSSVYYWGVPLIQKNMDIALLEDSEQLIRALNDKIKSVANNGGREKVAIIGPGILRFEPVDGAFFYTVKSDGTIYATNAEIPIGRNACSAQSGEWGKKDSEVLCIKSTGEAKYTTTYSLRYIRMDSGSRSFMINLNGERASSGEGHDIILEKKGAEEVSENGRSIVKTIVDVRII